MVQLLHRKKRMGIYFLTCFSTTYVFTRTDLAEKFIPYGWNFSIFIEMVQIIVDIEVCDTIRSQNCAIHLNPYYLASVRRNAQE